MKFLKISLFSEMINMDKQTPLRDNYITCTEPVNPYHGNYVVVSLTKPYCLNLPPDISTLWGVQAKRWKTSDPSWSDASMHFIMPTHCVRTWSNSSYWWNPNHYFLTTSLSIVPLPRVQKYFEPQLGATMYMYAHLLGMGNMVNLPYRYSLYGSGYATGDPYFTGGSEYSRPFWTNPPQHELYLNDQISASPLTSMKHIAGLNMTLFMVDISKNTMLTTACTSRTILVITLRPLVPYVDLSGCWLQPPDNYNDYDTYIQPDWDGLYPLQATAVSMLSPIVLEVGETCQHFDVVLPVQLYTLAPVGSGFTFTLQDVSNGSPASPSMEVVATRIRGYFWDDNGEVTEALYATGIHFELQENTSVFQMSHSFQEKTGRKVRPLYCSEVPMIAMTSTSDTTPSLLFSPRCGPGIWTNLPKNNF